MSQPRVVQAAGATGPMTASADAWATFTSGDDPMVAAAQAKAEQERATSKKGLYIGLGVGLAAIVAFLTLKPRRVALAGYRRRRRSRR